MALAAVPILDGGSAEGPDRAEIRYTQGSDFVGRATGSCEAAGILVPEATGLEIVGHATSGAWVAYQMDVDYVRAAAAGEDVVLAAYNQTLREERVPFDLGDVRLTGGPAARVDAYGGRGPLDGGDAGPLVARFGVGRMATAKAVEGVRTLAYYQGGSLPPPYALDPVVYGIPGPTRQVTLGDGSLEVSGDVTLYLEDVDVWLPGGSHVRVPARRGTDTVTGVPGMAELGHHREHWAFLVLHNARFALPVEGTSLYCGSLAADLDGTLNAYGASGRVELNGRRVDFQERELTLTATLRWREGVAASGVAATATGWIQSANLDFGAPLESGRDLAFLLRLGLWGTLLAALGAGVVLLSKAALAYFSRLDERAVLSQPSRRRVLELVQDHPHITLHALTRASGLSKSEVRYHAAVLEHRGLLRSRRILRDRCYVARETLEREGRRALDAGVESVLQRDAPLQAVLRNTPAAGIRLGHLLDQVAAELGISKPGAWKAVARAERLGLLTRSARGRQVWVSGAS